MARLTIVGQRPPTGNEVVALGCPVVERPPTGWDILRERLWISGLPNTTLVEGAIRTTHAGEWRLQSVRPIKTVGNSVIVEAESLGWVEAKQALYEANTNTAFLPEIGGTKLWGVWNGVTHVIIRTSFSKTPPSTYFVLGTPFETGLPATSPFLLQPLYNPVYGQYAVFRQEAFALKGQGDVSGGSLYMLREHIHARSYT